MNTIALTDVTVPRSVHSLIRWVVSKSRPQSSALMISRPSRAPAPLSSKADTFEPVLTGVFKLNDKSDAPISQKN